MMHSARQLLSIAVAAEALDWCETPYRHGQHAKGIGCDCIGLVGGVGLALGFASAKRWAADGACKGYGAQPDPLMLLSACAQHLAPIKISDAEVGDILMMRFREEPHHFSIITRYRPLYITHAYRLARKVCETPIDGEWKDGVPWRRLIVGAWRYKEVAT